jgi:hypothetical protein
LGLIVNQIIKFPYTTLKYTSLHYRLRALEYDRASREGAIDVTVTPRVDHIVAEFDVAMGQERRHDGHDSMRQADYKAAAFRRSLDSLSRTMY